MENEMEFSAPDLQSTMIECHQFKEKEKELVKDLEIYLAKLSKHREVLTRKEEELAKERMLLMQLADKKIKENRLELLGKLDEIRERMKHCYTKELSKAKEKHERELLLLSEKNDRYEMHIRQMSKQLYQLNERQLELQKENGILKNKLRITENNPPATRMYPSSSLASNFPTGRQSVRFSELQFRNSLAPPHLHSTYSAQYGDQYLKEEDISEANKYGK